MDIFSAQTMKKKRTKITAKIGVICLITSLFINTPSALALGTLFPSLSGLINTSTYISPVKTAPRVFTSLSATWDQNLAFKSKVEVRFDENSQWTDWYPLEPDLDGKEEADPSHPSALLPVNPTRKFQYKIVLEGEGQTDDAIQNLQFSYINASANTKVGAPKIGNHTAAFPGSAGQNTKSSNLLGLNTSPTGLNVITRAQWGADESLRLYKDKNPPATHVVGETDEYLTKFADELKIIRVVDKDPQGNDYTWPEQFPAKISKIIIHHTATTKDLKDPMKAIRDIYYFHTIARGWGDIGYNYIIDQQGNIYEGRAGGDSVVGAHAGKGNFGSIGVAVLGNYQDNNVPDAVIHSLTMLIRAKTQQYNINPVGTSSFRGEISANILGHRDVMSTSCPGDKLYAKILDIRQAAKTEFTTTLIDRSMDLPFNKGYNYELAQSIPPHEFDPGEAKDVVITIKNTSAVAWNQDTYMALSADNVANNYFITDGEVRSVAIGRTVYPGESATFIVTVQAGYKQKFSAFEFFPVVNGNIKIEKYVNIPVTIKPAIFDYQMSSLNLTKSVLKVGEQQNVTVELKNTGNTSWKNTDKNSVMLGTDMPKDHLNQFLLTPSTRLARLQEVEVKPGEFGHFSFTIQAPKTSGNYTEYFTPVIDGVSWFSNRNSYLQISVYDKNSQAVLTDKSTETLFAPGEKKTLWFEIKNVGGNTWENPGNTSPMDVAIRKTDTLQVGIPTFNRLQVKSGETVRVSMDVTVPTDEGFYFLQLRPLIGGDTVLQTPQNFFIRVMNGVNQPSQVSQNQGSGVSQLTPVSPIIRIALGFNGNPTVGANGSYTVQADGRTLAKFTSAQTATVSYENNQYVVRSALQDVVTTVPPRFVPDAGTVFRIQNWGRTYNQFRGVLEARWYNSKLITINELPIEDYLKGTGEINDSQPYEKLKAIIVVARTYATFYVKQAEKFPGAPYHLTDDAETSQKYVGYSSEKNAPNTLKAVADTANQVVTYKGKLVKTPFFSSDDGRTRSAFEVWGWKDTEYLQSVPDPYCTGKQLAGHGVGLSGCGSLGMANAGKNYQEIIKYYYQGVEIAQQ